MAGAAWHFRSLGMRRMPGFERRPFRLEPFSPGLNLIFGPNASGKTTTARALAALVWPGLAPAGAELEAEAEIAGRPWRLEFVRGGLTTFAEGEPLPLPWRPPPQLGDRYRWALEDLLAADDAPLAGEILRESAGGFDLRQALEAAGFAERPSRPRKKVEALAAARRRVAEIEARYRELHREEERLAELRQALAGAQAASLEAKRLGAGLALAQAEERHELARERLAAHPPSLASLAADAGVRATELAARHQEASERLSRARAEAVQLGASLEALGAAPGELAACCERARSLCTELERWQARLLEAERQRAGARSQAEAAGRALGGRSPVAALRELAPPDVEALAALLHQAEALRASRQLSAQARAALGASQSAADPRPLERAAAALGRWLAAPGSELGLWGLVAALAAELALVASALLLAGRPGLLWLVPASGALAGLLLVGRLLAGARQRKESREAFTAAGLPPPPGWKRASVEATRRELEERLGTLREAAARQRVWQSLEPLESTTASALERGRRELEAATGLGPEVDELHLAWTFERASALARALDRLRAAEAEEQLARSGLAELLAELGAMFGADVADPAAAKAGLVELERRAHEASAGARALEDRQRQISLELQPDEAQATQAELAFWQGLGLHVGDRPGLDSALVDLERSRRDRDELLLAEKALADARESARLAGELEPAPAEELARRLGVAHAAAGRETELREQIAGIESRVAEARRSHNLELALAERDRAEEALAAAREEDYQAAAGWVLARHLAGQGEETALPPVLSRARELFSRITRGRYQLHTGSDEPAFFAHDRELGRRLALDQLSAATRIQLLLAVRLAFLEGEEAGLKLPLLLDETLATSDAERTAAVVATVLELAREGRQVFCFTSQEAERQGWLVALEAAAEAGEGVVYAELELGREQRATRGVPPQPRPLHPARPVPPAAGLSHAEYGRRLGVPPPELHRGDVEGLHLWYLVEDGAVLEHLVAAGFEWLGPALELARRGSAAALGQDAEAALARAQLLAPALEAALEAWRVGRGRPVDAEALAASGAVSEVYLPAAARLAAEVEGDAAAFLARLESREGPLRGFRRDKLAALEDYLVDQGHLDRRPRLQPAQIRLAALEAAREALADHRLRLEELDRALARLSLPI